jgi:glucose/mannose transport system substrate-binding protein
MTFEAVLPAVAGPDYYERFWTGRADPADEEIQRTLDEVLFLYCGPNPEAECNGYFNSDIDEVDWARGVQKIVTGDAAMAVMGDWAKGYLEDELHVADEDFGVVPFPGSNGTYVFTADTFPLPRGANDEATRALLATFASVEGQVAFNSLKGSIPARSDIDPADFPDAFDAMDARTIGEFREGRRVLALSGLVASGLLDEMAPKLKESMRAKTTTIVQQYLSENYASLK